MSDSVKLSQEGPSMQVLSIEYEDGTLVKLRVPDVMLLSNGQWIDWLVTVNDPENET